jgi:hypothetical protein
MGMQFNKEREALVLGGGGEICITQMDDENSFNTVCLSIRQFKEICKNQQLLIKEAETNEEVDVPQ